MRVLVTGSSGHLGAGLVETLRKQRHEVVGLDLLQSPSTTHAGSITDRALLRGCMRGVDAVIHSATLHKPHVETHSKHAFIETNVDGTLAVLESAVESGVSRVVYSSTTSVYGAALRPPQDQPAAWIDEEAEPVPRNIYGVTKRAAEDLCELFFRAHGLPCIVLRISRFFPETDDDPELASRYDDLNLKANEFLYRRLDLEDAVDAHLLAVDRAPQIGFARYVVSATSPFERRHVAQLRTDAPGVLRGLFPDYEPLYRERGWRMFPGIDRVYVNDRARRELGWKPRFDFPHILDALRRGQDVFSPLARGVGSKGYHRR